MEVIVKTQKVFPVSWASKNKPSLFSEIDAFHPVLAVCGVWWAPVKCYIPVLFVFKMSKPTMWIWFIESFYKQHDFSTI